MGHLSKNIDIRSYPWPLRGYVANALQHALEKADRTSTPQVVYIDYEEPVTLFVRGENEPAPEFATVLTVAYPGDGWYGTG